jgi:hypothetical protein
MKESYLPSHFRQEEMWAWQETIKRQRSLFVAGLSGMGKSNLARFFVSHPTLQDNRFMTVYVDCNLIGSASDNELIAAIISELARLTSAEIAALAIDNLWILKQTLRNQVEQICGTGRYLVIVLDQFDQFLMQKADPYSYLRHLRDISGARISYILIARRCLPRASLGELAELFEAEPLWLGPLKRRDAFDSIERDGERLCYCFSEEQKQMLYELTGGHPGLWKNVSEMIAAGLDLSATPNTIIELLLQNASIQAECKELWSGLDEAEKDELKQHSDLLNALSAEARRSLQTKGILTCDHAGHLQLFSPIFHQAIQDSAILGASELDLQLAIHGRKVFIGAEECRLTPKEFLLFTLLFERRGEIVTYDEIACRVWTEDKEGSVSDEMIHTLRSSLEHKLKTVRETKYIQTHRDRGLELPRFVSK